MLQLPTLSVVRRGAWIINTTKHLLRYIATDPGLISLENVLFSGKCGSLLIRLSADDEDSSEQSRVIALARLCGIGQRELDGYLETLKACGCVDWSEGRRQVVVLAHSRERVLKTTSDIFERSLDNSLESVLLVAMEACLQCPLLESEIRQLAGAHLTEEQTDELLDLVNRFGLLGVVSTDGGERLYYNGYQFGDRAHDIGRALNALPTNLRAALHDLVGQVSANPGLPMEQARAPREVLGLAIALGIVEVSRVSTNNTDVEFLTMPKFAPPAVGEEAAHLEDDVFHHTKALLSSLRFGQLYSPSSRGRIADPPVLVRALLQRDRVGPCTAIGHDYTILEAQGVIRTSPSTTRPGQFYMELRRKEPAEMAYDLLTKGSSESIDIRSLPQSLTLPNKYTGPEDNRLKAAEIAISRQARLTARFLEELRT